MALPSILGPIAGAVGTALLQRTYLMRTDTATGIPIPLVVLDAVVDEVAKYSASVTQHPVESGPEVSDHIQLKNPTLSLKGTISQNPLDLATSIGNLLAGGIGAVTSGNLRKNILNTGLQTGAAVAGAALLGNAANPLNGLLGGTPDALARSILMDAFEQRVPFDVVTKRIRYENMVIESLSFPRDQDTGFQLKFEIELIRLRIVSSVTTQITGVDESVVTSALQKAALGGQTSKGAGDSATSSANKSWLRSIIGG